MMIIEGGDLVGKTTLAHEIVKYTESAFIYQWFTKPGRRFSPEMYFQLAHPSVIQDRFHASSVFYQHLLESVPATCTVEQHQQLNAYLELVGCLHVFMYSSDEEIIIKRYNQRPEEEMYPLDKTLAVNDFYKLACESVDLSTGLNVVGGYPIRIDYRFDVALVDPINYVEELVNGMYKKMQDANEFRNQYVFKEPICLRP